MQRTLAVLLVVAGLVLGGWTLADHTGDDIGAIDTGPVVTEPAAADDDPTAAPPPSDEPAAPTSPPPATAPEIGRSSARVGDIDVTAPPAPAAIGLPSIGIDAAIVPVGIDPDGLMTVPEDVRTVGWYGYGASTASPQGTTVLAGHVDDRVQGRGAFFDLRAMELGDDITVTDEDGTTTTWVVTGRRTFDKASLPVDDLYRRDGAPRLVLITCGGEFDRAARSYESNVVVVAEPAP